jgi:hypothetical protein
MGWYGLIKGPVEGSCEHDTDPCGSIKCGDIPE